METTLEKPKVGLPVFLLNILTAFDRFIYYGFRAIVVLYLVTQVSEGGMGVTDSQGYKLYEGLMLAVAIASVVTGVLSDFVTKYKYGAIIGYILVSVGLFTIITGNTVNNMYAGLIIIALGNGFTKLNLNVLLGRLFNKQDKRRDGAFLFSYGAINIGAFASSIIIGLIAGTKGYVYAFTILMILAFLMAVFLFIIKGYLKDYETTDEQIINAGAFGALDYEEINQKKSSMYITGWRSFWAIFIAIQCSLIFWGLYEYSTSMLNSYMMANEFDISIRTFFYGGINAAVIIPLAIGLGFISFLSKKWKARYNYISTFGLAYILFVLTVMGTYFVLDTSLGIGSSIIISIVLIQVFASIAESFISPWTLSYLTRVTPTKITATVLGIFWLLTYMANTYVAKLTEDIHLSEPKVLISMAIAALCIGIILVFIGRPLQRWVGI